MVCMEADRYTEPAVLVRYTSWWLSYMGYSVLAGTPCQLLTAQAMPASAASGWASSAVRESKARHDIASQWQRQEQLFLSTPERWPSDCFLKPKSHSNFMVPGQAILVNNHQTLIHLFYNVWYRSSLLQFLLITPKFSQRRKSVVYVLSLWQLHLKYVKTIGPFFLPQLSHLY